MSQKIKSLLYFVCFMASAALYHGLEPEMEQNSTSVESIEMNKIDNIENIDNIEMNSDKVASLDIAE